MAVHISPDGIIRQCRATKRPCKYSSELHFETKEQAEVFRDYEYAEEFGVMSKPPSKEARKQYRAERFEEFERVGSTYHKTLKVVNEIDYVPLEDDNEYNTNHFDTRLERRSFLEKHYEYYDENSGELLVKGVGEHYKSYLVETENLKYPVGHHRRNKKVRMNVYMSGFTEIIDEKDPDIITHYVMAPERHESHMLMTRGIPDEADKQFYKVARNAHVKALEFDSMPPRERRDLLRD